MMGVKSTVFFERRNLFKASNKKRCPLVHIGNSHVKNPLETRGCASTSVLHDKSHGIGLIHETKLSLRLGSRTGVAEDTSIDNNIVKIGDQ